MKTLWFLEEINLYNIICPPKYYDYKESIPLLRYKKKDYIYFEDDRADKIYLIDKGKVKIGHIDDEGEEIIMAILSNGDIFGEKVLLGEHKRKEFAQVVEEGTCLCPVTENTMINLMRENVDFSLFIYKFLGFRFKKTERRLEILLFKDTKTRLIEFLKDLAEEFGYKNAITSDMIIRHPYSQKEMATLIGTSRPTLNLLLNQLKAEGILDVERKEIILKHSLWLAS